MDMKNATNEIMIAASDAIAGGATIKSVQAEFGLNYSQLWLFHTDRFMQADERIDASAAGYADALGLARGYVREGAGWRRNHGLIQQSWGLIAVRAQLPESRIRKDFARFTAVDSAGLRIGKGGRFLQDTEEFYRGVRADEARKAKAGTDFIAGQAGKAEAPLASPKVKVARKPRAKKAKVA